MKDWLKCSRFPYLDRIFLPGLIHLTLPQSHFELQLVLARVTPGTTQELMRTTQGGFQNLLAFLHCHFLGLPYLNRNQLFFPQTRCRMVSEAQSASLSLR